MRRITVSLLFTGLLLITYSSTASAAEDITTGGISTEMAPDDVKTKLGPDWELAQTANIERGKAFNFTKGSEGFSMMTLGPRIVYIEHQQFFPKDAPIVVTELTKALDAKYGQPTVRGDVAGDLTEIWLVDKNGNLLDSSHAKEAKTCADYSTKGPFYITGVKRVGFDFSFPTIPMKDGLQECGTVITANPGRSGANAGLATQLTVSVFDMKAATAWFRQAMDEFNAAQKKDVDAAMKNKPNL